MSASGVRRRGASGERGDLPINAEINVTSLVDVAFTLLVIFIITAPILQGGIEVAITRADVDPVTVQEEPFFITVMADGRVFMEGTQVTLAELQSGLPQMLAAGTVERVYIRGDSLAPYGPVLQILATTREAGLPGLLVAEPYSGGL